MWYVCAYCQDRYAMQADRDAHVGRCSYRELPHWRQRALLRQRKERRLSALDDDADAA